ncbi:MAG: CheW domain-containing protein, partial [Gammaproteobacteria bacterium]|nr:CheW domain-containing protein [Gammaproteobacteria bacterium]
MDQANFDSLRDMAQLIEQNAAPLPLAQKYVEYWYGAAFEVLGVRCVASMKEARKVVNLTPTIPIPGVKQWVRGLANIGGRVLAIADFSAFLSAGATASTGKQALVISGRGIHAGLVIDASFGGVRFPIDDLRQGLPVAEQLQPYVSGVFPSDDGDYAVFDIDRLLSDT